MKGYNTLSAGQIAELAGLVADGIATRGDADVKAPDIGDYAVGVFAHRDGSAWLRVDVGFGDFDVGLYALKDRRLEIAVADRLVLLADNILDRIAEIAATRTARLAAIRKAREMTDKALRRHDVGITVEEFGPAGETIMTTMRNARPRLGATFRLLDNYLSNKPERYEASTGRDFVSWVKACVPNQRQRLKQLARLEKSGAIIGVDVIAERAILNAGRTVGEVASELLAQPASDKRNERRGVVLSGQRSVDEILVDVREGCIVAFVSLPGIGVFHSREMVLHSCVPPTIANVLVGKSPSLVLDHPFLRKGVRIRRIDTSSPSHTFIYLRAKRRGVSDAEIEGTSIAA